MSEQHSNQWDESKNGGLPMIVGIDTSALPTVVDRTTWQAELDQLRVREKAHTREGDAMSLFALHRYGGDAQSSGQLTLCA